MTIDVPSLHVDPCRVTNYQRTSFQRESFLLFCYLVGGGHLATTVAPRMNRLLDEHCGSMGPFAMLRRMSPGAMLVALKRHGLAGQIGRKMIGLPDLARVCVVRLHALPIDDALSSLEAIHGVGMKTSRFYFLHAREGARVAALDRHLLRYLESLGHRVPKDHSPPSSKKQYARLSVAFLDEADRQGVSPADLDLRIWVQSSGSLEVCNA